MRARRAEYSVSAHPMGPAFDLLAAAAGPERGFLFERAGLGVAGGGAGGLRISGDGVDLAGFARDVQIQLAAIEVSGDAVPLAAGVLRYAGLEGSELTVAEHAVRRTEAGVTRAMSLVAQRDLPSPMATLRVMGTEPHDAFTGLQLSEVPTTAAYAEAVRTATGRIHDGELSKVVLARTIEVEAGRRLDPFRLSHRLRAVDPDAYAFAVPTSEGVLVGASPELLVARRGLDVQSNPLAGSAPRSGDPDEDRANAESLVASAKDREEHAIVVEAVGEALHPLCEALHHDPEPVLLPTANVWHLSTRFRGTLREPAPNALELVAALHPTPAVCGTPRTVASALIAELEPFDRGCYAGPVGWMDANGDGEWAIALRCAELRGERATLYAGAGIVADSVPEREVDETERKFRGFLDSLRWG